MKAMKVQGKLKMSWKVSPLALGGILFLLTLLLVKPMVSNTLAVYQTYQDKQAELEGLVTKNKQLTQLKSSIEGMDLDKLLTQTETYLPSEKPSLATLMSLMQLARREQVFLSGITLTPGNINLTDQASGTKQNPNEDVKTSTPSAKAPAVKNDSDNSFDLSFSITGNKTNLQSFVVKLREIAPMMTVEVFNIALTKGSLMAEGSEMVTSLNVKVYYKKFPTTMSAVGKPIQQLSQQDKDLIAAMQSYLFLDPTFRPMDNIATDNPVETENTNPFAKGQ